MSLIQWSDALSVGIPQLDAQHKRLIDLVNSLHEAMARGAANQIVGEVLSDLISYTVTHFQTEEKSLRDTAYPAYAQHKAEHERLVKQVNDLKKRFDGGQASLSVQIQGLLRDWLVNHIRGTDKQYTDHLLKAGLGRCAGARA